MSRPSFDEIARAKAPGIGPLRVSRSSFDEIAHAKTPGRRALVMRRRAAAAGGFAQSVSEAAYA